MGGWRFGNTIDGTQAEYGYHSHHGYGIGVSFRLSYLLYLATFSAPLARAYFRTTLGMCRMTGVGPSLLLHPVDFMGADDVHELGFFPAMNRGGAWKMTVPEEMLGMFCDTFEVVPMGEHARRIESWSESARTLPVRREALAV